MLTPIVVFALVFGVAAIVFVRFVVAEVVEQQVVSDLRWRAQNVFHIIDSNLDELQCTGQVDNDLAVRDRKVNALLAVEDFARANDLKVTVFDGAAQRQTEIGIALSATPAATGLAQQLGQQLTRLFSGEVRLYTHEFGFEPWRWRVSLTQDNRAYLTLLTALLRGAGIAVLIFVLAIAGFMVYLTALTRRPIRAMVRDLEANRPPRYEGVAEFEYLGRSIATMMEAVNQQSQLMQARAAAEAANQAKSTFLANMSHELRTPLNAILGYAQILARAEGLNEREAAGVQTILTSGEHLLTLINDILDLARVEAGKLELAVDTVEPAPFLRGIADVMRVRAEQKQLTFRFEPAADLPAAVRADAQRLRQVLLNLLGNAVKFTDKGEVSLRVSARAADAHVAALRFEVHDSGVGIAPEQLGQLFQPFQQVGELQRQRSGTGLGLAISRQLVRLMGGDISVQSTPGQGSVFSFELRLPPAQAKVAPPARERVPVGYDGPRRRVLVVDDVYENRAMLADMLRPLGFSIDEAEDGAQGVERAQALRPDVILMDNIMPVVDGLEATRSLRALPEFKTVPIFTISASASKADRERALAAGATEFLPKPFRAPALFAMLEEHLGLRFTYR
ncbi:MAG TPA: ATP-binding protein [Burkholderiaceae bacterium]|nr:ATP-binding protein [Burkholderiaceae bacterium]